MSARDPSGDLEHQLKLAAVPIAQGLVMAAVFIGVFLSAFHDPRPDGVAVRLAGPPAQVQAAREALDRALPGATELEVVPDGAAARDAIEERDAYGAVVFGGGRAQVLFSGANGPVATTFFTRKLPAALQQGGIRAAPVDVVPLSPEDTSGLVLFYVAFGTVLASFIFSIVSVNTNAGLPVAINLAKVGIFAALLGPLAALIAVGLVGAIDGHALEVIAIVSLLAAGTSFTSLFLLKISRPLGTLVPAILLLTLGNASGGTVPRPFLPDWLAWLTPLLPGGNALSGLRGAVYFDGAGLGLALAVLLVWVVVPVGALELLGRRTRATAARSA